MPDNPVPDPVPDGSLPDNPSPGNPLPGIPAPAAAPLTRFQRAGLTFAVRDSGSPAGDPVVLLHGFPQDSRCWRPVETRLHEAGLRTLAPDQRGYSPQARPPARRDYRSVEMVDDVLALLDAADLPSAHVVGHDWGGAIAWLLAGRHPQRVRSLTVLSTPHPGAMAQAFRSSAQGLRSAYMLAFQAPVLPEVLLRSRLRGILSGSGLPRESAERDAAAMAEPGALHGAVNWYRGLPLGPREPTRRTTVPTTYIWGRDDRFLGRAAAEGTAAWVRAPYRFEELAAGHWLPETHPDQVAALILERAGSDRS